MKKIIPLVGLLVIVIPGIIFLMVNQNDKQLTEAEVREKFRCDRITADALATDIYCKNPEYYYQDAKNGTIINPSDFSDPRYKALYGS